MTIGCEVHLLSYAAGEENQCSSLIHTQKSSRYTIIVFEFAEEPAELSAEVERQPERLLENCSATRTSTDHIASPGRLESSLRAM